MSLTAPNIDSTDVTDTLVSPMPEATRDIAARHADGALVAHYLTPTGAAYRPQARFTLKVENDTIDGIIAEMKVNEVIQRLSEIGVSATDPSANIVQQGETDVYFKNGHEVLALDGSYYHIQLAIRELRLAGLDTTLAFIA